MTQRKRQQLFVEKPVQGSLLIRVAGYWLFCLLTVTLWLLCWSIVSGPPRPAWVTLGDIWYRYAPALVASILLLPMVVVDAIRWSNRFVGPILRFRRSLQRLAAGETVTPIHFREGDYWHDITEHFNIVLERIQGPAATADQDIEEDAGTGDAEEEPVAGQRPT